MTSDPNSTRSIAKQFAEENRTDHFDGFDGYMTRKLFQIPVDDWRAMETKQRNKYREKAYHQLSGKLGKTKFISRPTLRRWFGLDGELVFPKRIQILDFSLLLGYTEEEMQDCLRKGIYEPGVQINDYQEVIYLYCAANGFSLGKCQDMIRLFEQAVNQGAALEQKSHTDLLWKMYQINKIKTPARFLSWMVENSVMFKGYSMMSLKVFREYREKIIHYVQKDMRQQLKECLEETDFAEWSAEHGYSEPDYDAGVVQYIKNKRRRKNPGLSEDELDMIQQLHLQAYSKMEKNAVMLCELYAAVLMTDDQRDKGRRISFTRKAESLGRELHFMTDDYVSKLLTVAQQKEKLFRISVQQAKSGDAKLLTMKKSQKQRCRLVQRSDILPMVQYVAARHYMEMQKTEEEYSSVDARQLFVNMAAEVLKRCDMAPLDKHYRLDHILLSCFETGEVSYMSELLEIVMELI